MTKMNLQLFADEEAAESYSESEVAVGVSQNPTDEGVSQDPADTQEESAEEYEAFETLIGSGGRYEQDYRNSVSAAVQDRVKNIKPKADAYDRIIPMMERLSQKYGVDGNNIDALIEAVENDSGIDEAMYEEEAIQNGWTVEHTKEVHRLRQMEAEQNRQSEARRFFEECYRQADEFKGIVPDFDFDAEFQGNREFGQLVSNGVSVKNAYFSVHADEFIAKAMKTATQKATQQVVNSVISGSRRVNENGNRSGGAASFGVKVEDLTNEQLAEYSRRALKGEKIDFINNY